MWVMFKPVALFSILNQQIKKIKLKSDNVRKQ